MKTLIVAGAANVGGVIASRSRPTLSRRRLTGAVAHRMLSRIEQLIASLPEGSPPKLIVSIVPQNEIRSGVKITAVARGVGYRSYGKFVRAFREAFGADPHTFRSAAARSERLSLLRCGGHCRKIPHPVGNSSQVPHGLISIARATRRRYRTHRAQVMTALGLQPVPAS